MANPKKICSLLNESSAVRAKQTKLNVRETMNFACQAILQEKASLWERLFSHFKRQTLFVVTLQIAACQCAMKSLQEPSLFLCVASYAVRVAQETLRDW